MAPTTSSSKKKAVAIKKPSMASIPTKSFFSSVPKAKVEKSPAAPSPKRATRGSKTPSSPKTRSTKKIRSLEEALENHKTAIRGKATAYRTQITNLAKALMKDDDEVFRRAVWPLWNSEKVLINMINHPEKYQRGDGPFGRKYRGGLTYHGTDEDHWLYENPWNAYMIRMADAFNRNHPAFRDEEEEPME